MTADKLLFLIPFILLLMTFKFKINEKIQLIICILVSYQSYTRPTCLLGIRDSSQYYITSIFFAYCIFEIIISWQRKKKFGSVKAIGQMAFWWCIE